MTEEFEEPMQFRNGYPDTNVVSSEECVEFVFMKVQVSLLQDQKAALQTQLAQSEAKLKIAIEFIKSLSENNKSYVGICAREALAKIGENVADK